MKLTFIGGGNMATALIAGLKNQRVDMSDITVIEINEDKRSELAQRYGVATSNNLVDAASSDTIVLAMKPQQLPTLAKSLAPILNNQLVISIAAGIRIADLCRWLGNYQTIVRCMPNTPAQIQEGVTGLYAMPKVSRLQIKSADQILSAAGKTLWLDSEEKLDAVTAISGSGPAYVFYFIEALHDAAIDLGLSDEEARLLSLSTFKGASLLAESSTTKIATLRSQVTSKGGTTEQGLLSLENAKVRDAIIVAAQKACERAKTLGDELGRD
jgi:pyrroline-5-carboxylate reductase